MVLDGLKSRANNSSERSMYKCCKHHEHPALAHKSIWWISSHQRKATTRGPQHSILCLPFTGGITSFLASDGLFQLVHAICSRSGTFLRVVYAFFDALNPLLKIGELLSYAVKPLDDVIQTCLEVVQDLHNVGHPCVDGIHGLRNVTSVPNGMSTGIGWRRCLSMLSGGRRSCRGGHRGRSG